MEAEGSNGRFGEIVAGGDDPTILALVEVADCQGVAGRPEGKLFCTGSPARDEDG